MWLRSAASRRRVLRLGALGLGLLLGGPAKALSEACNPLPPETAGPFPANRTTGPNLLAEAGVVRQDIRTSLGTGNTASGVPLMLQLQLAAPADCAPLTGYALYVWHCDRSGRYSLYSPGAETEDYLRGVQAADQGGQLSFKTVFPACYPGRWPHVHVEVYRSLDEALGDGSPVLTSQLALPQEVCAAVYGAAEGYAESAAHLRNLSLDRDVAFRDGAGSQLLSVTGSLRTGYTASLAFEVPDV